MNAPQSNESGSPTHRNSLATQVVAAVAAFATYFCMYAFRKPFSAATMEEQQLWGMDLKAVIVLAQLAGYMLSKFLGIKVIAEMPRRRRAVALIFLIVIAESALVAYAYVPISIKPYMIFLNGLPLGMIFGLVLAYLEGRRHTEALSAVLCASFIMSSGYVKSIGRYLIESGVNEFHMPYLVGLMFFIPLLVSVWILDRTPEPAEEDRQLRSERSEMNGAQRWEFFRSYAPGLTILFAIFAAITVIRTIRDDFGVEIWRDLNVDGKPAVFAQSETYVAVVVTSLAALAIIIRRNVTAIMVSLVLIAVSFTLIGAATLVQPQGQIAAFPYMVICGVGLYIPYVIFHTTIFERIVAASRKVANLGFLMYLADSIGYLCYAILIVGNTFRPREKGFLRLFQTWTLATVAFSLVALVYCAFYFRKAFDKESE
ncbi:MAG: DUF5690 family protein, partial [Planctomycetota bacterium]